MKYINKHKMCCRNCIYSKLDSKERKKVFLCTLNCSTDDPFYTGLRLTRYSVQYYWIYEDCPDYKNKNKYE